MTLTGLFIHVFVVFTLQNSDVAHSSAAGHFAEYVDRVRAVILVLIRRLKPQTFCDVYTAYVLG